MKQAFSRQRSVAYYDPPPSPVPSPDLSYVDVCQHTRSRTIDFGVLDYCSSTAPPSYTTFIESQKSADLENQKFQNQQKGLTRSTSFTAGSTQQATHSINSTNSQQRSPTKIQPTSPLKGATVVTSPTTVPSAAQNFANLGPRPIQRVASTPNLVNSPKLSINPSNSVKSSSFTSGGSISGIQSTPKISNIRTAPTPNTTPNTTANSTPNSAPNLTLNQPQQTQSIHSPQTTTPGTTQVPLAPQFVNPKSVPATAPSPSVQPQTPPQPSVEPIRTPAVQSEEERGRPTSRKAENVQRLSSIKLRRTQSNRRIESRDNSGWFSF